MNKYEVHISFVLQAEDRMRAWGKASLICKNHLRDFANVDSVSIKPLPDPDEWIAVNEPIRTRS